MEFGLTFVVPAQEGAQGYLADCEADSETEIGQATFAFVEVVQFGKDVREGGEEDVEVAVGDGEVKGHEEDDGGSKEEFCRA